MKNHFDKFKVRAKRSAVDGGGYVYGYPVREYGRLYVEDAITHDRFQVEDDDVDLIVGYIPAKDGLGFVEVYEGDRLTNKRGDSLFATIQRYLQAGVYSHPIDLTELAGEDLALSE